MHRQCDHLGVWGIVLFRMFSVCYVSLRHTQMESKQDIPLAGEIYSTFF